MTTRTRTRSVRVALWFLRVLPVVILLVGDGASASGVTVAPATAPSRITSATVIAEINAVRARFHLSAGQPTTAFSGRVIAAAKALRDPVLAAVLPNTVEEDGIWGEITTTGDVAGLSSMDIVDAWVYEDGWRGVHSPNIDCTSPSAPGCNGHRRAVLRRPPTPGATLSIDVHVVSKVIDGERGISIAAILSWNE